MLFFDADLSVALAAFDEFWKERNDRTVLIGSRVAPGAAIVRHQPFIKEWAGRASSLAVRALLPLGCRDTQCGFKLFPANMRALLPLSRTARAEFDVEWLMIALRNGLAIKEIPVRWTNREDSRFTFIEYPRALLELAAIKVRDMQGKYHFK